MENMQSQLILKSNRMYSYSISKNNIKKKKTEVWFWPDEVKALLKVPMGKQVMVPFMLLKKEEDKDNAWPV